MLCVFYVLKKILISRLDDCDTPAPRIEKKIRLKLCFNQTTRTSKYVPIKSFQILSHDNTYTRTRCTPFTVIPLLI